MDEQIEILRRMYGRFNARDIDAVLATLADDVAWANGMEGGHVHGWEGLRQYWTRQWSIISPHVEPVRFLQRGDDCIVADVIQSVFDLDGKPLGEGTHGLKDKTVRHVFHFRNGKVTRFDIAEDE